MLAICKPVVCVVCSCLALHFSVVSTLDQTKSVILLVELLYQPVLSELCDCPVLRYNLSTLDNCTAGTVNLTIGEQTSSLKDLAIFKNIYISIIVN